MKCDSCGAPRGARETIERLRTALQEIADECDPNVTLAVEIAREALEQGGATQNADPAIRIYNLTAEETSQDVVIVDTSGAHAPRGAAGPKK